MKTKLLGIAISALLLASQSVTAASYKSGAVPEPLYPLSPLVVKVVNKKPVDTIYPSVAGDFLVYSTRSKGDYGVERVSKNAPASASRSIKTMVYRESIRFGVAIEDGSVGYVTNRTGPIAPWMWLGDGESHVAIGHMGGFRGAVAPYHLNANQDGSVWCYDTSLQKVRQNMLMNEFVKYPKQSELIGQLWRSYDSDSFRYKQGYLATETGKKNDFFPPVLYVLDRSKAELVMIPGAFDGTISPDGRNVVFVRETNGNYDLWMQTINGGELIQLTNSRYGDFEPQFSPDGRKLLFVSNRDSAGKVPNTSIYVMDMQSYQITRLTNAQKAIDGGPTWFDKNTVVFHSNRDLKQPQSKINSVWNIWQLKLN